jgi:hypothetical protein
VTPSGSDTASLLIISTTAHTLSAALPMTTIVASALTTFGLLGLVIAGCATERKRLWQTGALLGVALAMVTAVAGCNGPTRTIDPLTGTPAGAYTVTVTATSGNTTHQANVTLIVR